MPKQKKSEPKILGKQVIRDSDGHVRGGVLHVDWDGREFLVISKKYKRGTEEDPEFYGGFWFNIDDAEADAEILVELLNAAGETVAQLFDFQNWSPMGLEM